MRRRFWIPVLLIGLLLMGVVGWWVLIRSEEARLAVETKDRVRLVATALRDNAYCVELHAQQQVAAGSAFFLLAPHRNGSPADTIAHYTAEQQGRQIPLDRTTFPMPTTAIVDIAVRMRFLAPPAGLLVADTAQARDITDDVERSIWTERPGGKLKLLDTTLLAQLVHERLCFAPFGTAQAAVVDTVSGQVLYASGGADPVALRRNGTAAPLFERGRVGLPLVLYAQHPDSTAAVMRAGAPMLAAFLLLMVVFSVLLWQYGRTAAARERLAQMRIDLVSNMSHEFNTPIANIALALDTLKKKPTTSSRISNDQLWDIIHVENKRLHATIRKVLDVSMVDRGQLMLAPELHDMDRLLTAVAEEFRLAAQRQDITLELRLLAQKPWVRADATYLTNVLHVLVDNAIKYSGEGATVILRSRDHDGGVLVEVRDNGPGIPKADRELVFEKFYRVRNGDRYAVKGTGIGLYYARQVVEAHGGWITLTDERGPGCCFQLFIPDGTRADDQAANS